MPRRPAPAIPTPDQIRSAHKTVAELIPGARIAKVGPDGISFDYPDATTPNASEWRGKPFSADGA